MKPLEIALIGIAAGAVALIIAQRQDAGQGGGFDIGSIGNAFLEMIGMSGIRNTKPGNIRHSNIHWQGQSSQQTDPAFVQFISPEYGIRALSRLLDTYSTKYNLNTVKGIIVRYAPSSDTD